MYRYIKRPPLNSLTRVPVLVESTILNSYFSHNRHVPVHSYARRYGSDRPTAPGKVRIHICPSLRHTDHESCGHDPTALSVQAAMTVSTVGAPAPTKHTMQLNKSLKRSTRTQSPTCTCPSFWHSSRTERCDYSCTKKMSIDN